MRLPGHDLHVFERDLHHVCWIVVNSRKQEHVAADVFTPALMNEIMPYLAVRFRSQSTVASRCDHTCALKDNGSLICFGRDVCGQCTAPPDLGPVTAVAAALDHTCALRADGQLVCFGDNRFGQCEVPASLGHIVAVAAGCGHTCAVNAEGELVCFGDNRFGQCQVPSALGRWQPWLQDGTTLVL